MISRQRSSQANLRREAAPYGSLQIDEVRASLRAYYRAEKDAAVLYPFTWNSLRERIAEDTGVTMDADTLRQFALEAVSRGRPRGISRKYLRAIEDFLSDPDIGVLSFDEQKPALQPAPQSRLAPEPAAPHRLALELIEFLRHGEHSEVIPPPSNLQGVYRALDYNDEDITRFQISLKLTPDGQAISVEETAESFDPSQRHNVQTWGRADPVATIRKQSAGFAILTPEDNVLFFMKQTPYPCNHYYMTMALDINFRSLRRVNELVLLRHDYPLEIAKDDDLHDRHMQARTFATNRVLLFVRNFE